MTKEEIQHLLDHSNPQSEEALEFSSMLQFHNLGWQCEYAMNEDESNSFLGRKDFTEVVLDKHLLPKLKDLKLLYFSFSWSATRKESKPPLKSTAGDLSAIVCCNVVFLNTSLKLFFSFF